MGSSSGPNPLPSAVENSFLSSYSLVDVFPSKMYTDRKAQNICVGLDEFLAKPEHKISQNQDEKILLVPMKTPVGPPPGH